MRESRMLIGSPGANWTDQNRWHGHLVVNLKRTYDEWKSLHYARDEFTSVMTQYGHSLGVEDAKTQNAAELGTKAFNLAITEVRNDNLVYLVAPMMHLTREEVAGMYISHLPCAESPFGGCLFEKKPEFGDTCVFCGLHFR
jgi:hypothetical protein